MELTIDNNFITKHRDLVTHLLIKKNKYLTAEDLQDLNQEVFHNCIIMKDYYDEDKGQISTWINLVVIHTYDRYLRTQQPIASEEVDITDSERLHETNSHFYFHNKYEINYYFDLLPEGQRDKLYMHLILGYTHKEISEELDITEHSSRTMCSAAVKNLRQLVDSDDPEHEVLHEVSVLQTRGLKSYQGDWSWRPDESPDRTAGEVKIYTPQEIQNYIAAKAGA